MNLLVNLQKITKSIKLIDSFNLWKKRNSIKNDTTNIYLIDCLNNGKLYNELQCRTKYKINLLTEAILCTNSQNLIYSNNTNFAADTVARIVYENMNLLSSGHLLIHFQNITYYEKMVIKEKKDQLTYKFFTNWEYIEGFYNPYHLRAFFNFVLNIQLIENICAANNIKLHWTSNCYLLRKLSTNLSHYCNKNYFFVRSSKTYYRNVAKKFAKFLKKEL